MNRRWMMVAAFAAVVSMALAVGCGDGMPWEPDCSVGLCGEERETAEEMARQPDVELDGDDELGRIGDGEDIAAIGEVTDRYAEVTFQADAGQWYDIAVYSLGLPTPSFVVSRYSGDYERWSPFHETGLAQRSIVPTRDGTHTIRIYSDNFKDLGSEARQSPSRSTWEFVLHIQHRDPPEPQVIVPGEPYETDLRDLRENLFVVDVADDIVELGVDGGVSLGTSTFQYGEEFRDSSSHQSFMTIPVSGQQAGSPTFLADYVMLRSSSGESELEVRSRSGLRPGEAIEQTRQLDEQEALVVWNDTDRNERLDIEIERDGVVVDSYSGVTDDRLNGQRGIVHVAENSGEYVVRMINNHDYIIVEPDYDIDTELVGDAGVFQGTGERMVHSGESLTYDELEIVRFELADHSVVDVRTDDDDPRVRIFEQSLIDGESSGTSALTAGTHHALVQGRVGEEFEDYEIYIELSEAVEPIDELVQFDLQRGDLIEIYNPYTSLSYEHLDIGVEVSCDGESVLQMDDLGDERFQQWVMPIGGDCQFHFISSPWTEELEELPEAELVPGIDLGNVDHQQTAETTLTARDSGFYPFTFEIDDPAWVVWRLDDDASYSSGFEIDTAALTDNVVITDRLFDTRVAQPFDAGVHTIVVEQRSDNGDLDGDQALLEVDPVPDVITTEVPELEIPAHDDGPDTTDMEISGCGVADRIAVDLDIDAELSFFLQTYLQSPLAEEVTLWNDDLSVWNRTQTPLTFPDGTEPEESMNPLSHAAADGTWTLELMQNNANPPPRDAELTAWTMYLWCE